MHGLKRTMRSKPQYRTPKLGSFSEEYEDAISYAQRVSQEYAKMEDGHHAPVRQFLQRAYIAVLMFRHEPDAFERLKTDPFWQASRQKPRDASTSKWVLYFIMEATTTNVRNRAGKYAVILDGLIHGKAEGSAVAERIEQMGGVEAAYESMRARKRGAVGEGSDGDCPPREPDGAETDGEDDIGAGGDGVGRSAVRSNKSRLALRSSSDDVESQHWSEPRRVNLDDELVVEAARVDMQQILDSAAGRDAPVDYLLGLKVFPPDEQGWVRIVAYRVKPIP
jgi:hypothetical protein